MSVVNRQDEGVGRSLVPSSWEYPSCDFCGNMNSKLYLETARPFYGWHVRLVECLSCRLVRQEPRPQHEEILNWYRKHPGGAKQSVEAKLQRRTETAYEQIFSIISHFSLRDVRTLFDVGCGAGQFMEFMQRKGVTVEGNDINPYGCELIERRLKAKTYNVATQHLKLDRTFDCVTMLDYLEHTYTPFSDLKFASSILRPHGILFLKTLYLNCPNHIRDKENWKLFGVGHFHYFYQNLLASMVKQAGFNILGVHRSDAIIKVIGRKVM